MVPACLLKFSESCSICTHLFFFQGVQLRLSGGPSGGSGRLEVFYRGEWGTVCDDDFDSEDATVVCRQLGYTTGTPYVEAHFGQGSGPILMDDVHCHGDEAHIAQCPHNGFGVHDCSHSEDIGVMCIE